MANDRVDHGRSLTAMVPVRECSTPTLIGTPVGVLSAAPAAGRGSTTGGNFGSLAPGRSEEEGPRARQQRDDGNERADDKPAPGH